MKLIHRLRRLRTSSGIRDLTAETRVSLDDLIYPLFAINGHGVREEIHSLPGNYHLSVDLLLEKCQQLLQLGLRGIILFGLPEEKDASGSRAWADDGIVQRAVSEVKRRFPELVVCTDVCLCQYTSHGHCGILRDGELDNDLTVDHLADIALSHARSGADLVAPSDMMDGRVGRIRRALDNEGFESVGIMSYSAKYASAFYGPFRHAADSAPERGDRRGYQMNPANRREAMREIALDVTEGADVVMVKPALAYLDVLREARDAFDVPLAAYNVSGEYAMVKVAAANDLLDEKEAALETLTAIKRAGADLIITYWAEDVARWLSEAR